MGDLIFILLPVIIVAGILLIVVPIAAEIKNKSAGGSQQKHQNGKNRTYNREVDAIHITTDAATERRRRLDQLKSLYDASGKNMTNAAPMWKRIFPVGIQGID